MVVITINIARMRKLLILAIFMVIKYCKVNTSDIQYNKVESSILKYLFIRK